MRSRNAPQFRAWPESILDAERTSIRIRRACGNETVHRVAYLDARVPTMSVCGCFAEYRNVDDLQVSRSARQGTQFLLRADSPHGRTGRQRTRPMLNPN